MTLTITALPVLKYIKRAWVDGKMFPAMGFIENWNEIVVLNLATKVPVLGERLIVHEWWHAKYRVSNAKHAPWYTFRVECGHFLRLRDPAGLHKAAAAFLKAQK